MANGTDADFLQVLLCQVREDPLVDFVVAECRLVFFETQAPQPDHDVHDGRPSIIGSTHDPPGEHESPGGSLLSIPKKLLEPLRRQSGIARRILDVAMPEIGLDRTRVVAVVGELVTAGMPQHVGMMPGSATTFDARLGRAIKMSKQGPLKLIEHRTDEQNDG
jgi:hypothetical protein